MEVKNLLLEKTRDHPPGSMVPGDIKDTPRVGIGPLEDIAERLQIIILPKMDTFSFSRIDFVRLDESRIMVILVSRAACTNQCPR